jgi:hypothetical protein
MRSNNAISLLPFNLFEFSMLAEVIAVETGSRLGPMSDLAMSMHIYERDLSRAEEIIAAGSRPGVRMAEMPKKSLDTINKLARLEAELRHSGHAISDATIDEWISKKDDLGAYWSQFYLVLLFHSASKISNVAAKAVKSHIHAPFLEFMPEPRASKVEMFEMALPTGRPTINVLSLDSRRMRSVRRKIEQLESSGDRLPVRTIWALQEEFMRIAARLGGDDEVSESEFLAALTRVRAER